MRLTSLNQLIREGKTLEGVWRLSRRHKLEYRRRTSDGEEEIVLAGELMTAEPTGLVFRLLERSSDGEVFHRLLTLRGRWQADPRNRLQFLVERERGGEDRLTFAGGWEVTQRNEILYRYDRVDLKTKRRELHDLLFRGYWDLDGDRRLAYLMEADSDSVFRFRGSFESASIAAKKGFLRYQLGIEAAGRQNLDVITLFGKWKLSRDLALEFEVPYARGFTKTIRFGAAYAIDGDSQLIGHLTARDGKPLGLEVILARSFLKGQGEAFVRLKSSLEEQAVEGGVRFRW